jgi:hypothetical protein
MFFILVRLKDVNAVSVPEKNAEQATRMSIKIIVKVLPSGSIINDLLKNLINISEFFGFIKKRKKA